MNDAGCRTAAQILNLSKSDTDFNHLGMNVFNVLIGGDKKLLFWD
ncbi:MAG: hypothetical protein VST67_08230 [Nitrospirota bacterium]|nr:hypothetical protein [Nitrospirota bacterium]